MVTLLLHQQSVPDALAQFRTHVGWLRSPPASPPPPPAAAAAHALWLQRQYAVMGELLATRVDAGVLPDQARRFARMQIVPWCVTAADMRAKRITQSMGRASGYRRASEQRHIQHCRAYCSCAQHPDGMPCLRQAHVQPCCCLLLCP